MSDRIPPAPFASRRRVLVLSAVVLAVVALGKGAAWVLDQSAKELRFTPVDDPPGFRRLSLVGATSTGRDPFAGLEGASPSGPTPNVASDGLQLCQALFGRSGFDPGVVPIAFFSDYNCPYCEVVSETISKIEAEAKGAVQVKWHEWPLLGAASGVSARAALAAARQGAYARFHRRLLRTSFEPTPAYLRELALSEGIDPDRLIAEMDGEEISREIEVTRVLVRRLAFPGTPALVVGRTIVVGAIRETTLRSLIAQERADGPPQACASTPFGQ